MKRKKSRSDGDDDKKPEKLKGKDYDKELERLHVELVKLQRWVVHKGLRVCIVFEGRDGAGKGGTIKAITERVSPRVFRVVACRRRPSARKARSISNATCAHFPRRARS
jgi:polyphosphate kinase 2 (PPK2 family)